MLITQGKERVRYSLKQRLKLLRQKLEIYNLDAFVVPHRDMYFNEITPSHSERLKWITGFSGSAGIAIIQKKTAILFTDGRYTIQVKQEVDQNDFDIYDIAATTPFEWLQKISVRPSDSMYFSR